MIGFDFKLKTRILYGCGTVSRLGEVAASLEAQNVLLVTDTGIAEAGLIERGLSGLVQRNIRCHLYDRTHENPTTRDIEECAALARDAGPIDLIIGFGGGSSLDTAKGANFLLTNGGKMADYRGFAKAREPLLPMIAVPTTAGTGSEVQSFAVIGDVETHLKMACGDPSATPKAAILDPELTLTQPPTVTACTGIDAISHAFETAVTRKRNEISLMFSREALRLTMGAMETVLRDPDDLTARGEMLLGACLAGLAIENSMLGAAHAAANPLTARFGTIHGAAVGVMLPHIVRRNGRKPEIADQYRNHAASAGVLDIDTEPAAAVEVLAERLCSLVDAAVGGLRPARPESETIAQMAFDATEQMTALHNPLSFTREDFEELYREAL